MEQNYRTNHGKKLQKHWNNHGQTTAKLRKNLPNTMMKKTTEQLRNDTGTTTKHYGKLQKKTLKNY